ncbi:MAG: membrane protein insertase YidC, partial [Kiloniellales bacterium]
MEQRNLILAIVLTLAIVLGFQLLYVKPQMERELAEQQAAEQAAGEQPSAVPAPSDDTLGAPSPPGSPALQTDTPAPAVSRSEILAKAARVRIETPALRGSISLAGGRIDDLILTDYRVSLDEDSPEIVLLSPGGSENPYFANFGWTSTTADVAVPTKESVWRASGNLLTPEQAVKLTWNNDQGLVFEQIFEIDSNYLFTVTQRVRNEGSGAVTLSPYGLISRTGTPDVLGFYILHEGLLGVFDGTLKEIDYDDLQ